MEWTYNEELNIYVSDKTANQDLNDLINKALIDKVITGEELTLKD